MEGWITNTQTMKLNRELKTRPHPKKFLHDFCCGCKGKSMQKKTVINKQSWINWIYFRPKMNLKLHFIVHMTAKSLQSCLTLCDPIDSSLPGSSVPGILQARTLEWVAISFSNTWKWKVKVKSLSHVQLFVTPWTIAYQVPPSMGYSRQEYWSDLQFPSLDHPNPGIEPGSPAL